MPQRKRPDVAGDEEITLDRTRWARQQREYWSEVARRYDALYADEWSRRENDWVADNLAFISSWSDPVALDLACGTGLGHHILTSITPNCQCLGIDISPTMVALAKQRGASAVVGSMDDLSFLQPDTFNVVISLFGSFSFAYDSRSLLASIARVLRQDGVAYLSILSKLALSQYASGASTAYQTRHDPDSRRGCPVRRLSVHDLCELAGSVGMTVEFISGMNVLSGVMESPGAWNIGREIASVFPDYAHTIEARLRKGK